VEVTGAVVPPAVQLALGVVLAEQVEAAAVGAKRKHIVS